MDLMETPIGRETLYEGKILDLERMTVRLPNGREASREIVRHRGACVVAAVDGAGRVALVRQYRAPIGRLTWELPAGKLEAGEDPLLCAQRELAEETGYTAGRWTKLTALLSTPGFCDEVLHTYLATDLTRGQDHPDEDEFVQVEMVPMQALIERILAGDIADGKTIAGVLLAREVLSRER